MTIAIGNDHAGPEYKFAIVKLLEQRGIDVLILEQMVLTVWTIQILHTRSLK